MPPNGRRANTARKSQRDWVLLVILFAFNLWSAGTTVIGAQQVLPLQLAWVGGIAVQAMLFCILAGWAMPRSIMRRGIAVIFFSIISIYTSFFCYYGSLTGNVHQRDAYSKAAQSHRTLIASVYTQAKEKSSSLQTEIERLKWLADQECKVGITTGQTGCGPKARDFLMQVGQKESEYRKITRVLQEADSKFNYPSENLTPNQIYLRDLEALATLPEDLRNNYKVELDSYISRDLDIELLTPYYKLFKQKDKEPAAIFALLIAIGVDGMAILQGTAIEMSRRRIGLIQLLAQSMQHFIRDIKSFNATFSKEVRASGVPVDERGNSTEAYGSSTVFLRKVIDSVDGKSNGKGDQFLSIFYSAISANRPYYINYAKLKSQDNEVFHHGFNILIRKMMDPDLGWIEQVLSKKNGKVLVVRDRFYKQVSGWIESEIIRLKSPFSFRTEPLVFTNYHAEETNSVQEDSQEKFFDDGDSWIDVMKAYKPTDTDNFFDRQE
jgi:hypothetical protein